MKKDITIKEITEELRNKILDIETAVRLTYNEKDSDQMIDKLLNHYTQALQTERQRCEEMVREVLEETGNYIDELYQTGNMGENEFAYLTEFVDEKLKALTNKTE